MARGIMPYSAKKRLTYIFNRLILQNPDKTLLDAIKAGDKSLLEKALTEGVNLRKDRLWGKKGAKPFTAAIRLYGGGSKWAAEDKARQNMDFLETMLKNGADPNERDSFHGGEVSTPLRYAAAHGMSELATLLKKYGAEVDYSIDSKVTITPLAIETLQNHSGLGFHRIHNLISYGADVNKTSYAEEVTPLLLKARNNAKVLHNPLFATFGASAYIHELQDTKTVMKILLDAGANPLVVDKKTGKTALETLRWTFENAAAIIPKDENKKAAEDPAFKQAADDLIQLLTTAEADWKKPAASPKTPEIKP